MLSKQSNYAIIYRSSVRGKYVKHSWPPFIRHTNPGACILVLINTADKRARKEALNAIEKYRVVPQWVEIVEYDKELGMPGSVNQGVRDILEIWPKTEYVLVQDNDILTPNSTPTHGVTWDQALVTMLDAGWGFVGHPMQFFNYDESKMELKEIGGVRGIVRDSVGGAMTGFRVEDWERVGGSPEFDHVFGYAPQFQQKVGGEVGYYYPLIRGEHFDVCAHELSLAASEYAEWTKYNRQNRAKGKWAEIYE